MKALFSALIILSMSLLCFAGEIKDSKVSPESEFLNKAEVGDTAALDNLLKSKSVKIDTQGDQGLTALMQAAVMGHMDTVKFLIKNKANLEIKNEIGDTALAMAVSNEQLEIADELIKAGSKLDISCGGEGNTLLMCATQINDVKLIKLILKKHPKEKQKKNKAGEDATSLAKTLGTKETKKALGLK